MLACFPRQEGVWIIRDVMLRGLDDGRVHITRAGMTLHLCDTAAAQALLNEIADAASAFLAELSTPQMGP